MAKAERRGEARRSHKNKVVRERYHYCRNAEIEAPSSHFPHRQHAKALEIGRIN